MKIQGQCHSEGAIATKKSHNLLSKCCGLLRHFVMKISHLKVNVPHNDMTFYISLRGREGIKLLIQSEVVILND